MKKRCLAILMLWGLCPGNGAGQVFEQEPRFTAACEFVDAAISSLNAFGSIVKKEAYRTRVASLQNPASAEMGFSLEAEVQSALRPLLAKARQTNASKFSAVVSTLVGTGGKGSLLSATLGPVSPVFSGLLGLVGNLAAGEKRITAEDLDSFIHSTSRYFAQYQRLQAANASFESQLRGISGRLAELQFDLREHMLDLVMALHPKTDRRSLAGVPVETVFLRFLDPVQVKALFRALPASSSPLRFPPDGIKTAKDILHTAQKLFAEYGKVYSENYRQVRSILADARSLGRQVNTRQVDQSLKELEQAYEESRSADVMGLRLATLEERVRVLAGG